MKKLAENKTVMWYVNVFFMRPLPGGGGRDGMIRTSFFQFSANGFVKRNRF